MPTLSVGFWFSLGHSTSVFAIALLLSIGIRSLVGPVDDDPSTLHTITGVIGPSVSGVFIRILKILNLAALLGILRVLREMRSGTYTELGSRSLMNRFLGGLTKTVTKP